MLFLLVKNLTWEFHEIVVWNHLGDCLGKCRWALPSENVRLFSRTSSAE